jgi:glycosyltransferase involved in cell wall biosynthesis
MVDVSVIIPTYNRLWCLPRAINSCRSTNCQTEIIVVDDGSTDGTWEWLQLQTDIVAVRQENQGQTYAINKGVTLARGKYIRFLDSDDFLTKDIIDKQFLTAEDSKAELVYSRVDIYEHATGTIKQAADINPWDDFLEVQLSNSYGSHFLGMLFKTECVEKIPRRPDFSMREDRMFLLEYGLLEPKIAFVEGCAGYWVKHNDQMQGNYSGLKSQVVNWQHLHIFKKILQKLQSQNRLHLKYKKAACTILWPLAHWIAIYNIKEAFEVVKWIYELNPEFNIPDKHLTGWLYKNIGFKHTEKLLKIRRVVVDAFR